MNNGSWTGDGGFAQQRIVRFQVRGPDQLGAAVRSVVMGTESSPT